VDDCYKCKRELFLDDWVDVDQKGRLCCLNFKKKESEMELIGKPHKFSTYGSSYDTVTTCEYCGTVAFHGQYPHKDRPLARESCPLNPVDEHNPPKPTEGI